MATPYSGLKARTYAGTSRWPANFSAIAAIFFFLMSATSYASSQSTASGQEARNQPIGSTVTLSRLTESQKILQAVLDDIRDCNRKTSYGIELKTNALVPRRLHKLKGLHLLGVQRVNPHRLVAKYQLNENYGGVQVVGLELSNVDSQVGEPLTHSVLMKGNFQKVRQQLERLWGVDFVVQGGGRVGPEGPLPGETQSYGYVTRTVNGNERILSINHTSLNPSVTRVDCGQGY